MFIRFLITQPEFVTPMSQPFELYGIAQDSDGRKHAAMVTFSAPKAISTPSPPTDFISSSDGTSEEAMEPAPC